jgi:hypothetical protein
VWRIKKLALECVQRTYNQKRWKKQAWAPISRSFSLKVEQRNEAGVGGVNRFFNLNLGEDVIAKGKTSYKGRKWSALILSTNSSLLCSLYFQTVCIYKYIQSFCILFLLSEIARTLLPDHPEFTFGFCFYVTQSV